MQVVDNFGYKGDKKDKKVRIKDIIHMNMLSAFNV